MNKHRSTPLGNLYSSPLKAESKPTYKFMKKNSTNNDTSKLKCSSINAASHPNLCVSTLKSQVQSNKDQQVPQTVQTSQTAIRDPKEDEVNGALLMSIDSVGSSIDDHKCLVKALNCLAESSMDASETRDEKDGDALKNVVFAECGMKQGVSHEKEVTNSDNLGLNCNETNRVSSLNDVGHIDGNAPTPDRLNSSLGNKYQCDVPITNMPESSSHVQTKIDNGLGELIDVRVCDICGDIGREALLALCSKCSDGAEHIYCMRVKMETVPQGDWVCEDCMITQDSNTQPPPVADRLDTASKPSFSKKRSADVEVRSPSKRRVLEGNVRPLKLSGSRGVASLTRATSLKIMDKREESPPRIYSHDDLSAKKVMEKGSSLKSSLKNRTLQKNVRPVKSYGSARKTVLTQVSSLKITDKRKVAVLKSTSVDERAAKKMEETCLSPSFKSVKPQHIHGGYEEPSKGKLFKRSNSNVGVRRPYEDVKSERDNFRESKKLVKSMSFIGVRTSFSTPNSHLPPSSNVKGLKCSGGEKSKEKYGSSENRCPQGVMRVNTSGTKLGLEIVKNSTTKANTSRTMLESEISKVPCSSRRNVESMKVVQEKDNSNAKALANTSGKEMGSLKNANSDANYRSAPLKVEPGCFSRVDNDPLIRKAPFVDSHPNKELLLPLPSSVITAVPGSECIWRGAFELEHGGKLPKDCSGIQAHLSTFASSNVLELVHKFQPKISVKQVARSEIWPNQFERNYPSEKDVAIYFFAEDFESYLSSYKGLLDEMMENDLGLEANFDGFRFLIFPSNLLPSGSQRWNTLYFLWGVFRVRTLGNHGLQDPSLNTTVFLKQGQESFDPMTLQCPESTKTGDRGGENEISLKEKCLPSRETLLCEPVVVEVVDDATEKKCFSDGVPCSDGFQKEDGRINPSTGYLNKTHIVPYYKSDNDNQVLLSLETGKNGFNSDVNNKHPLASFALTYDPTASKLFPEKRLDVVSWSSISVDSGPSGSSDGGGCARSDEGQVEQLHDPPNCSALNLDLCLGSGLDPQQRQVDLDLVLGLSKTSKHEHVHRPKGISYDKGDISLALSLGMPYSNG